MSALARDDTNTRLGLSYHDVMPLDLNLLAGELLALQLEAETVTVVC